MPESHRFHHILEQLRDLQVVLNEKFQLEKKVVDLPSEIALKERVVFRMKESYLVADSQYQDLKKNVMLKRDDLERLQSHREKYEQEIAQVSSQRDYEQIDRAIKENQEQELVMRSEFNALESKLKAFEEEYTSTENLLKLQEEELVILKKDMESKLAECKKILVENKKKETHITSDLDDKLVFNFERIIKSKDGDGIVPVRKNICNGCHMVLPLQFVNEVCKEEEVLNCPYCSKILFYDGNLEIDDIESEDNNGLQDLFEDEDIELDEFDDEDYELFMDKDNIGSDSYSVVQEDDLDSSGNDSEDDDDDDLDADDNIDDDDTGDEELEDLDV